MTETSVKRTRPIILRAPTDTGNFSRILRPSEFEMLLRAFIMSKPEYASILVGLLATGMRYQEIVRFHEHLEWFFPDDHVIDPLADKPMEAILSLKKTEAGSSTLRKIYLSDWGVKAIREFAKRTASLRMPSYDHFDHVLNRIAITAGFDVYEGTRHFRPVARDVSGKPIKDAETKQRVRTDKEQKVRVTGISQKALRKTWISWLLTVFPEYEGKITDSMGHSSETERRHYRSLSFSADEIQDIWKYVDGFIPDKRRPNREENKEEKIEDDIKNE